jgi:hypothetical protein
MQITGKVILHSTPRRKVILWDNPIAIADGYSVWSKPDPNTGEPIGQFAFAPIRVTDLNLQWTGTWSANSNIVRLTNEQMVFISTKQPIDGNTIKQKMNWVMDGGDGSWGAPIRASYTDSSHWMNATDIQMISAVYAGQWVEVLETRNFTINFNGKIETNVPMCLIKSYDPSQWNNPLAFQDVTAVDKGNEFNYPPVGRVKLPIWFGSDKLGWILQRWLEPQ